MLLHSQAVPTVFSFRADAKVKTELLLSKLHSMRGPQSAIMTVEERSRDYMIKILERETWRLDLTSGPDMHLDAEIMEAMKLLLKFNSRKAIIVLEAGKSGCEAVCIDAPVELLNLGLAGSVQ